MKSLRPLIVAAFLAAVIRPASAGEAMFPQGARVGLTPLVGLVRSKSFPGFESEDEREVGIAVHVPGVLDVNRADLTQGIGLLPQP